MPALPVQRSGSLHTIHLRASTERLLNTVTGSIRTLLKRTPIPQSSGDASTGIVAIPTVYQGLNSGPAPGTVVGIVLGSVAGFLLLIWILWALSTGNGFIRTSQLEEEEVEIDVRRGPRSRRSQAPPEMRSRSPVVERIIRQERRTRTVPVRQPSRIRETIIVEEDRGGRRVDGDDVIEVMEEESVSDIPPPRRKSRRSSGYR